MSSSVLRRLHGLFACEPSAASKAATAATAILKPDSTPKPTFTTTTTATAILKPVSTPKPTFTSTTTSTTSKPKKPTKTIKTPRTSASHLDRFQILVTRFKKLSESENFRAQSRPYTAIIRRLSRARKYSYIEDVIEHQKNFEIDMSKESFVARLIRLYGKSGMFEHAHKLFDDMPQLNCDRTVLSFNALLTACVWSKKYDKLIDMFRKLPVELSIKPDDVSYDILKRACDMGAIDCVIKGIGAMERDGCELDLMAFNIIIYALYWQNRHAEAVNLIREMEGKGVKPDIYTYNKLLTIFCHDHNLVEVKKCYGEIRKNDLVPDFFTFLNVVPFACDVGEFVFAHELSKEAIDGKVLIGEETLQRVVDGLVKELEMDKAKELVKLVNSSKYLRVKLKLPTNKFQLPPICPDYLNHRQVSLGTNQVEQIYRLIPLRETSNSSSK